MFAAVGIGEGIHMNNPDGGWLIPVFAGLVAATALAIFWHVVIGNVVGMIRRTMMVGVFLLSLVVTLISLGASAQAIATAIAGHSALTAELSAQVDEYGQSLAKAFAEATRWRGVQAAANAKAAGFEAQAKSEEGGSHGTGKGCGPKCSSYRDFASSFQNGADALAAMLKDAAEVRDGGDAAMSNLRDAAARGDQNGFMAATEGVAKAIAALNAVDPSPIIAQTGGVTVNGRGIDLTKETKDFNDMADKSLAKRQFVKAPVFAPMSLGDATRRQMLGAAMHGWILAGAIDLLPFFFLCLAFFLSREVWLNEEVTREQHTHTSRDDTDRDNLDSMFGRTKGENVVSINRTAAE